MAHLAPRDSEFNSSAAVIEESLTRLDALSHVEVVPLSPEARRALDLADMIK
jgi:hypothetical protein